MQKFQTIIEKVTNRFNLTIALTCIIGWGSTYIAIYVFEDYALTLFMALPVAMGLISTLMYGYNTSVNKNLFKAPFTSLLVYCLGILLFAWEGLICIAMVLPIGIIFTLFGYFIGYVILKSRFHKNAPLTILIISLSMPLLMAFEKSNEKEPVLRSVTTKIEIEATREEVWANIVQFPPLKQPTELLFRAGVAYPVNATIDGNGVGSIRHCNFSTGTFVEPITVWDAPRLLKFSVREQPAPMKELSFYDVNPNHLHGYWLSKQGQFKLTSLSNGHTLVEGTTWYVTKIKPEFYWSVWSDYIVHTIHNRVLMHIKENSED